MIKRLKILIITVLLFPTICSAQTDTVLINDTLNTQSGNAEKKWYQSRYVNESIVPLGLGLGSAFILSVPGLKVSLQKPLSWNWDQNTLTHKYNLSFDKLPHDFLLEDEMRYVPVVAAYAISLCGVKSKHRFIDKSIVLAVSYITSDFVVHNTKKLTKSFRPGRDLNSPDDYSFPSQHTAMAFIAATFLHRELGYVSPWISVGGYAVASYVAIARVANNDHWTSDVLMGAAVGTLMTNASYWAYDGVMKLLPKNLSVLPVINAQQAGLYLCYRY